MVIPSTVNVLTYDCLPKYCIELCVIGVLLTNTTTTTIIRKSFLS